MSSVRRRREGGFTLVELLAGLAVLGLLSLVILTGVGGRSLAWSRMARTAESGQAVAAAQALVRRRLEHAVPWTIYYIVPPGPDFRGGARRLVFLAPPPPSQTPGPLRRYQLTLDTAGELVFDSLSDVALDQNSWSAREVLLRGVQSMDLSYFGQAKGDHAPGWRADWQAQPIMPGLVRLHLTFPEGDARRWPDLIVHPLADIDTACVLAVAATGSCRGR